MNFIWYKATAIQIDWRCLDEVHESIMDSVLIAIDTHIKNQKQCSEGRIHWAKFPATFDAVLLLQFCSLTSTTTATWYWLLNAIFDEKRKLYLLTSKINTMTKWNVEFTMWISHHMNIAFVYTGFMFIFVSTLLVFLIVSVAPRYWEEKIRRVE